MLILTDVELMHRLILMLQMLQYVTVNTDFDEEFRRCWHDEMILRLLLSILQSGEKNVKTFRRDHRLAAKTKALYEDVTFNK